MIVVEHHNNGADLATAQLQRAMRSEMPALEIWLWQGQMALNGTLTPNSESSAQASRLAAYKAIPYMKIRSHLTRQIHADHVKASLITSSDVSTYLRHG